MRRVLLLSVSLLAPSCDPPAPSGSSPPATTAPLASTATARATTAHDEGPPRPRPATPQERAILTPLAPGADLAGYAIVSIDWTDGGVLEIVCKKGSARVVLTVAAVSPGGPTPPASTDRYAVFYSLRGADPDDGDLTAKALVRVLEANKDAPPPPGLGPFVPRPISL